MGLTLVNGIGVRTLKELPPPRGRVPECGPGQGLSPAVGETVTLCSLIAATPPRTIALSKPAVSVLSDHSAHKHEFTVHAALFAIQSQVPDGLVTNTNFKELGDG
jgi:hypothetical protein